MTEFRIAGSYSSPNSEETAPATTVAEKVMQIKENRASIMATNALTSWELMDLDNETIALKLYFLINNGSEKSLEDFYTIGSLIGSIAADYKR